MDQHSFVSSNDEWRRDGSARKKWRLTSSSVFASPVNRFIVGLEEKELFVHTAVLTAISKPMKIFLTEDTNAMKKSFEHTFYWKDVELSVCLNFIEYAYNGNYRSVILRCQVNEENGTFVSKDRNLLEWYEYELEELQVEHAAAQHILELKERSSGATYIREDMDTVARLRSGERDLSSSFFPHVKLYALAKRYDIDNLRRLCLHKLHLNLVRVPLNSEFFDLLAELIDLVWSFTKPGDDLRSLIIDFIICDPLWMTSNQRLLDLSKKRPELAAALWLSVPKSYWMELQHI